MWSSATSPGTRDRRTYCSTTLSCRQTTPPPLRGAHPHSRTVRHQPCQQTSKMSWSSPAVSVPTPAVRSTQPCLGRPQRPGPPSPKLCRFVARCPGEHRFPSPRLPARSVPGRRRRSLFPLSSRRIRAPRRRSATSSPSPARPGRRCVGSSGCSRSSLGRPPGPPARGAGRRGRRRRCRPRGPASHWAPWPRGEHARGHGGAPTRRAPRP
mmetsp:Transcript_125589/g.355267  ORF Transcript_125589/g.355267 Transcript_125589/m.355267 type:complete len:210 (-) Transcript_125589:3-632(-)